MLFTKVYFYLTHSKIQNFKKIILFNFFYMNSLVLLLNETTNVLLLFYIFFRLYLLLLQRAFYISVLLLGAIGYVSYIASSYCDCQTLTDLLTTTCCRSYCHEYTETKNHTQKMTRHTQIYALVHNTKVSANANMRHIPMQTASR